MLWKIMVFFLLVIIFALLLKIFYMRKAIKEIKRGFSEKLYTDTNTPIMLSSYDKLVSSLANDINVELKELQKQKHRYIQGDKGRLGISSWCFSGRTGGSAAGLRRSGGSGCSSRRKR